MNFSTLVVSSAHLYKKDWKVGGDDDVGFVRMAKANNKLYI